MKIPILKFIYYCYLESEKISEDFKKYEKGFTILFLKLKNKICCDTLILKQSD